MSSAKLLLSINVVAVIAAILHATGSDALTRYNVGGRCDSGANCLRNLCCTRMTEREGNKCRARNSTVGARCSETRWPKARRIDSYLGGCPCAPGFKCQTNGQECGTCQ